MIVSLAICRRDEANALNTLEWAHQLDGKVDYECILTVGHGVTVEPMLAAASKLFRKVTLLTTDAPDAWPQGKNLTFQDLVRHLDMIKSPEPFFWWEPDAIPLKKGWLKAIEAAHLSGGKLFTGYVHPALRYLECVAVYPPNFMECSPTNGMLCRIAPWDVCSKLEVVPNAYPINELLQFVHDVDGFPPTFTDLHMINPLAVLFHKNKDGTLIEQLSKGTIARMVDLVRDAFSAKPQAPPRERITVVFPVSAKDIDQAIHHARWMQKLGVKWKNSAIVAFDMECPTAKAEELRFLLTYSFSAISTHIYPTPPDKTYPAVANWAFARVAEAMAHSTAPWFWLEADAVVLKPDWLDTLQAEYEAGGKAFMGPIVKENGHGHANGSCVYPADAVRRIPRALKSKDAWDWTMREEMIHDCHDASHVICHIWGLVNGQPSQTNGAQPPLNFTRELARRCIPERAAIVHRIKDNSVVDLLMNGGIR